MDYGTIRWTVLQARDKARCVLSFWRKEGCAEEEVLGSCPS